MTHLTIELDEQTGYDLEARARAEGLDVQEWVERLVRRHVHPQWPDSVRALVGAWPDFPSAEELRQGGGQDVPRESW
ncbi:MAG: CopG family transcriptional regulator [Gammaproteobacteria bacterium]